MSTTTIRLPDDLKEKVARAAKRAGTTSHNFILEAIAEKPELTEQRNNFLSVAESRYAAIVASGRTIPWADMQLGYAVSRIELAPEVADDVERIGEIIQTISVLEHSPLIGRPATGEMNELVVGRSTHGYIAPYRYVAVIDTIFVLALRSQREAEYVRAQAQLGNAISADEKCNRSPVPRTQSEGSRMH